LTALMTAFYTFRALFIAFWGQPRDRQLYERAHESPGVMTWPLVGLALLALVGGVLGLPAVLSDYHVLDTWLQPVFAAAKEGELHLSHDLALEWTLLAGSSLLALLGIGLAYWFYVARPDLPSRLALRFKGVFRLLVNKYYVDDLYDALFVRPGKALAHFLAVGFDVILIDGLIDGSARLVGKAGAGLAGLQSGHIARYALGMFIGALVMLFYFLVR